jgi:hypothetical protein
MNFNRKWNKFLLKEEDLEEVSQKWVDKVKKFLDEVPPEKLSFNKIFGDKMRLVVPLEKQQQNIQLPKRLKKFVELAQRSGYSFDFAKGLISREREHTIPKGPQAGQKIKKLEQEKIGKFLNKMTHFEKSYGDALEERNQEKARQIYAEIKDKMPIWDGADNYVSFEMAYEDYQTMSFSKSGGELAIIISRHPIDVMRMSDFVHIQSCHSQFGSYFSCAIDEAKGHGLVAFAVKKEDLDKVNLEDDEIFADNEKTNPYSDRDGSDDGRDYASAYRNVDGIVPLSRLRLRRIVDKKNNVEFAVPEMRVYGNDVGGFKEAVDKWAKAHVDTSVMPKEGDLVYTGGEYTDNDPGALLSALLGRDENDFGEIPHKATGTAVDIQEAITRVNRSWASLKPRFNGIIRPYRSETFEPGKPIKLTADINVPLIGVVATRMEKLRSLASPDYKNYKQIQDFISHLSNFAIRHLNHLEENFSPDFHQIMSFRNVSFFDPGVLKFSMMLDFENEEKFLKLFEHLTNELPYEMEKTFFDISREVHNQILLFITKLEKGVNKEPSPEKTEPKDKERAPEEKPEKKEDDKEPEKKLNELFNSWKRLINK